MRIIIMTLAMLAVWILLTEEISLSNIIVGLIVSILTVLFTKKFFPVKKFGNVKLFKLITFPFFLLAQVYAAGFHVIKILFTGSKVSVIELKTNIKSETLKIILVDAITLTPGSVMIDLDNENVKLLWIRGKDEPGDLDYAEKQLKSGLERRLLKAQR